MNNTASDANENTTLMALFPGQGSQKVGMGFVLHENSDIAGSEVEGSNIAKEYFARADAALGFSLSELCFRGPEAELTMTAIAQPAILTVSSICFEIAAKIFAKNNSAINAGVLPIVAAAGHSLGEYSALVAAGVIGFDDAVRVVHLRGKYMQEAVPVGTGKMIAVLGKEAAELDLIAQQVKSGVVAVANVNAPGQIVVSGANTAVDEFVQLLGVCKVIPLTVSAPFHCALMQPAADKLANELAKISFHNASFPIVQNVNAVPETDGGKIRENLIAQVCGRVRWVECIENAVAKFKPARFVEFGNGAVLSGMVKRINSAIPRFNVDSVESAAGIF